MITIVSRWEQEQMLPELEWQMWRQLRGFDIKQFIFTPIMPEMEGITIKQFPTMKEALENAGGGKRVFLESTGHKGMYDLPSRDEDVIFVFGNTNRHNKAHTTDDESYRIAEPNLTNMYPTSAAAVVLAYWYGQ